MAGRTATLALQVVGNATSAVRALQDVSRQADQVAGRGRSIGSRIGGAIGGVVRGIATATAVAVGAVAGLTVGVIRTGIQYNVLRARARTAMVTILGSEQAADKLLATVDKFADTSPFPRQIFIEATQQMLAFGFEANQVVPILGAVQDAVAAAGRPASTITEVVDILSKVQSTGKFSARTLNELGLRGINAAKLIGDELGKTPAQVRDAISKGTLDVQTGMDALIAGMQKNFGGAADRVKKTWEGATDTIRARMRDIGSALVEPFISRNGGGYAVEWAFLLGEQLGVLRDLITTGVGRAMERLAPIFDRVTAALEKIDLGAIFDKAKGAIGPLLPILAPVISGLTALGGANLAGALGPLGAIVPKLNPILAIVATLIAVFPGLRNAVRDALPILGDLARTVGTALMDAFKAAMPALETLADLIGGLFLTAVEKLAPPLGDIIKAIAPVIPAAVNLATAIGTALVPIIKGLLDVIGPVATIVGAVLRPAIKAVSDIFAVLAAVLRPLAPVLRVVGVALGIIAVAVTILVGALLLLSSPITLIGVAIVGLVVLFQQLWKRSETFRTIVTAVFDAVRTVIGRVADQFRTAWNVAVAIVTGYFNVYRTIVLAVFNGVRTAIRAVTGFFRSAWNAAVGAVRGIIGAFRGFFSGAFGAIRGVVSSVTGAIRGAWNGAMGAVRGAVNGARSVATGAFNAVRGVVSSVTGAISGAWNGVRGVISNVANTIRNGLSGAFNAVRGAASSVAGAISGAFGTITAPIQRAIDMVNRLIGAIRNIRFPSIPGALRRFLPGSAMLPPGLLPVAPPSPAGWYASPALARGTTPLARSGTAEFGETTGAMQPPLTVIINLDGHEIGRFTQRQVDAAMAGQARRIRLRAAV